MTTIKDTIEDWRESKKADELREFIDKVYVPRKRTMPNLDRELLVDFMAKEIKAIQLRLLAVSREMIEGMRKKNDEAKCGHKEPRDITGNDYDCSDMHIGYAEAISDFLSLLPETSCSCTNPQIESNMTVAHCVKCGLDLPESNDKEI